MRVENIRPTLQQIENTLKNAKDKLKILVGVNQKEDIDVTGEFSYTKEEIPDSYESVQNALENNYDINSFKMKLEVDEAFIDLDRAEYWPSVYAFGNYSYAGTSDNFNFQNYSSSVVGLTFSMNLFKGGQTKNKVQQSEIAKQQSEQQLLQLKDFVSSEVKARINDLKKVKRSLEAEEKNVNLAERAYQLSIVRYKEGTGSQLEIQNADIALKQARTNRLQSVYEYIVANSALDRLLGRIDSKYFKFFDNLDK